MGLRFGRLFANELKRRRPRPGDKWHLDEVFIRVQGKLQYLWRAVDQHGHVLDILVQSRRNVRAAKRFFRKLLRDLQYVPRVADTGDSLLASFGKGIKADLAAVRAALTEPWSNGQTEGQITKLKLVKRQMYGRARLDLLRARLVMPSPA